jgi:hypothetical protein
MCARRFLALIAILTLIFVGGAFAFYQWGSEVLLKSTTPVGHYQQPPKGSGPDYSTDANWLAKPGMAYDESLWLPTLIDGKQPQPTASPRPAALFFVHPTTYLQRDRWNAPITSVGDAFQRSRMFVRYETSPFTSVADVWAPKYRQAAYGAFMLRNEDAQNALDLAYRDARTAFETFLAAQPKGRPIILAGHSQGAMHILKLLADEQAELKDRLVAAYVVGWPVGVVSDLPATGLAACKLPNQVGCVLSWQSFKEPANSKLVTEAWVGTKGLTGRARAREDMLCTNPISGTIDGSAPAAQNKGTLVSNQKMYGDAGIESGRVGARCDKGFLMIDGDIPNLGPYVLPGNNYHVYDYALFWGSIRADAERRVAAWLTH